MTLDKISSDRLKARLPRGFIVLVVAEVFAATKRKVWKSEVSMVLNGRRDDDRILEAIIRVAQRNEQRKRNHRLLARGKARLTSRTITA